MFVTGVSGGGQGVELLGVGFAAPPGAVGFKAALFGKIVFQTPCYRLKRVLRGGGEFGFKVEPKCAGLWVGCSCFFFSSRFSA